MVVRLHLHCYSLSCVGAESRHEHVQADQQNHGCACDKRYHRLDPPPSVTVLEQTHSLVHYTCARACCTSILRLGMPALAGFHCCEHLLARNDFCRTSRPGVKIVLYIVFALHSVGQLKGVSCTLPVGDSTFILCRKCSHMCSAASQATHPPQSSWQSTCAAAASRSTRSMAWASLRWALPTGRLSSLTRSLFHPAIDRMHPKPDPHNHLEFCCFEMLSPTSSHSNKLI